MSDDPDVVVGELIEEMRHAFLNRPRNRQRSIGPSEIGNPCDRAIICRLGGMDEPGDSRQVNLKAEVGTMIHAGLAEIFHNSPLNAGSDGRRFLVETPLTVGEVGGRPVAGTCDLFDRLAGVVIDHKTAGRTKLLGYRRRGMTQQQRVQVQLYGLGWHRLGLRVDHVGCLYLPRDGEMADVFGRFEQFNPFMALSALDRADALARTVDALGIDGALESYGNPICGDEWCRWCPSPRKFRPNGHRSDDPFDTESEGDKNYHA